MEQIKLRREKAACTANKRRSDFADRGPVGMNERNGARLRLPAPCSLSSYIVLLFEGCRRWREKERRIGGRERGEREQDGRTEMEKGEAGGEEPARRSGFSLQALLVSRYRGGHKGSRWILILVSPNLLTYLTYPRSSSGTLGQLNPPLSESSSFLRDNLRFSYLPLSSSSPSSPSFFSLAASSRF